MDKLTLLLYKSMGIMKEKEISYQSTFEDYLGQAGEGQEGHWTDPNVNIGDWHEQAVTNKRVPDVPEYWDKLRTHYQTDVQNKLDHDEPMGAFDWEVATRSGMGDDSMTSHMTRMLANSNYDLVNNPRRWSKQVNKQGGLHTMRRLFESSFKDIYGGKDD